MNYQGGYRPPAPLPNPPQRTRRRRKRHPALLGLLIAAVLIGAICAGVSYYQQKTNYDRIVQQVNAVQGVFLQNIYVDGINVGGMKPQEAIDTVIAAINARQNSWQLAVTYQGHQYCVLTYSMLGINTDPNEAVSLLREAYQLGHAGTYTQRKADMDRLAATPYQAYTSQTSLNEDYLNSILTTIQQDLNQEPVNAYLAYFDPNASDPFVIQKEQAGRRLDVDAVKQQILAMMAEGQSGSLELAPQQIAASVTEADIRKQLVLRAESITPISSASTLARTDNIRLAMSKYNGLQVAPGEQVSFNTVVGARTLNNGFQYAIEYVSGMEEPGVGGGVCQASTTVYLAALLSNLEIVSRTPHSDKVSYTTFGQDATVYYSSNRKIDFVFKNNTDSTLYIVAKVEEVKKNSYQCVVRIYGPSLGDNVKYKLRTQTVETLTAPLEAEYRKDTNHEHVTYKDEEYLVRNARDGFINETYLQRWEGNTMVSETLVSRDTCKARAAVYLVGTEKR